ncbi:MAG: hypothetical protein QOG34_2125 [Frankiaceae bacterium]|jgi:hypothetical protein|nr:hypothetical protein [Frankiaceae bacterium]
MPAWRRRRKLGANLRQPIYDVDQDLDKQALAQALYFRHRYANWAAGALGLQLVVADGAFLAYLAMAGDAMPASVMSAWLGAVVVEVIGVVFVITRNLFPGDKEQ